MSYPDRINRNEIDAVGLRTIDAKEIRLAPVVMLIWATSSVTRVMVGVAASAEPNRAPAKTARLALDPEETVPFLENHVVATVLAERDPYLCVGIGLHDTTEHHGLSYVADDLRMLPDLFHPLDCSEGV
jgi:hypothetical protein